MEQNNNYNSINVSEHPGLVLANILSDSNMTQKELAIAIGKPCSIINDIIKGKRNINAELALLLESVIRSVSAVEWMSMQSLYDLDTLKQKEEVNKKVQLSSNWIVISSKLNLKTIKKKVRLTNRIEEDVPTILEYTNCKDTNELLQLKDSTQKNYFRKSENFQYNDINLFTWTNIVRHESRNIQIDRSFNNDNSQIDELIQKINKCLYININVLENIKAILNEYGIKFIIIKKLDKIYVDGMSFWEGENPTIALTLRYDRIDNFAFNIFHELGHIVKHLKKDTGNNFICDLEAKNADNSEIEANDFAAKAIWRNINYFEIFNGINLPFASAKYLEKVAENLKINIGIIVGQYQHFCAEYAVCQQPYSINRNLIKKIG